MPRQAKRTSQKPAPGLPYGQGAEQAQALKVVPIPSTRYEQDAGALPAAQPMGPTTAAAPMRQPMPAPTPSPQEAYQRALQAAMQAPSPGVGLLDQSQRPGEPVTVGLSSGPGGGPEMLRYPTGTTASLFSELALATGDPFFSALARKAGVT